MEQKLDLIKRIEVLKALCSIEQIDTNIIKMICDIPSIESVGEEWPSAFWHREYNPNSDKSQYLCGRCSKRIINHVSDYCPHCGAHMLGIAS